MKEKKGKHCSQKKKFLRVKTQILLNLRTAKIDKSTNRGVDGYLDKTINSRSGLIFFPPTTAK